MASVMVTVSRNARGWVTIEMHSRVSRSSCAAIRATSSSVATRGHSTRMNDFSSYVPGRVRASPQ